MLFTGLTSITFRKLEPQAIIDLVKQAGFDGIEWGGNGHVPPGDIEKARTVRAQTEAAGLTVCSYGSYYQADQSGGDFTDTLEAAKALGAPVIRVWAGNKGSAEVGPEYRLEVAETLKQAVTAAKAAGITVALEYHGDTLTDTQASAHQLLQEVGLPELKLYWQPRTKGTFAGDIPELKAALPVMAHVHCFHWGPGGWEDRKPLADGVQAWSEYLKIIRQAEGDRYIIFEFVKDDSTEQFLEDAKVLRTLLERPTSNIER